MNEMRWCERKGLVFQIGGRMEITDAGHQLVSSNIREGK